MIYGIYGISTDIAMISAMRPRFKVDIEAREA